MPSSKRIEMFIFVFRFPQHIRNVAVSVLGRFRSSGFNGIRSHRYQKLYEVLGSAAVRIVLGDQHYRFAKHAHRYDVQFVSDNLGGRTK